MANLEFQDFNIVDMDSPFTSANSSQDNRPPGSTRDTSKLVTGGGPDGTDTAATGKTRPHFLSFDFYQRYFDVETEQVQSRILHSMVPKWNANYITDHVQPLPDLYGPFWIAVTLIFSTGICGNIAHFVHTSGNEHFENDFGLVTGASTLVACYIILVPFAIYSVMWYRSATMQYAYLELLCAYGYSLSIFVPVSILWAVVPFEWFRWALIAVSVALSGTVLAGTIWASVQSDPNRMLAFGVLAGVVLLHAGLAVGFKEFYFDTVLPADRSSVVAMPAAIPTGAEPTVLSQGVVTHAASPDAASMLLSANDSQQHIASSTGHPANPVPNAEKAEVKQPSTEHPLHPAPNVEKSSGASKKSKETKFVDGTTSPHPEPNVGGGKSPSTLTHEQKNEGGKKTTPA
ncbi:Yip1 domain-containing protein [Aphelenchoides avenae]|nr:Yip1 domain-containing protein [Aphelenchus avenae]